MKTFGSEKTQGSNQSTLAEEWRPVKGYEGIYEVSSHGHFRARGYWRNGKRYKARALNGCITREGYIKMNLTNSAGSRLVFAHVLVANAFLGPKKSRQVVRHLDGNGLNNKVGNLCYGTQSDNLGDARRHGTLSVGEHRPCSKLKAEDVKRIRYLNLMLKVNVTELTGMYGVSRKTIGNILNYRSWLHV